MPEYTGRVAQCPEHRALAGPGPHNYSHMLQSLSKEEGLAWPQDGELGLKVLRFGL